MSAARVPVLVAILGAALAVSAMLAFGPAQSALRRQPATGLVACNHLERVVRGVRIQALEAEIARKRELVRRLTDEIAERERRGYY